MTERPRGADTAGDVGRSFTAGDVDRSVTGWLGRMTATLLHPGSGSSATAGAKPGPAVATVADLVSARGLAPPDPDPGPATPVDLVKHPARNGTPPVAGSDPVVPESGPVEAQVSPATPDTEPFAQVPVPAIPEQSPAGREPRILRPVPGESTAPPDDDLVPPPWARVFAVPPAPAADPTPEPEPDRDADRTDRPRRRRRPVAPMPRPPQRAEDSPQRAEDSPQCTEDPPQPAEEQPATRPAPIAAPIVTAARSFPAPRRPTRFSVAPRPTVVDDLSITGLTRRSRGRWGSRVFTLFFVFVFAVILLQLLDSLLYPLYRSH